MWIVHKKDAYVVTMNEVLKLQNKMAYLLEAGKAKKQNDGLDN